MPPRTAPDSSTKYTLPPGTRLPKTGATEALRVRGWPKLSGLGPAVREVDGADGPATIPRTGSASGAEVLSWKSESPLYATVRSWDPAATRETARVPAPDARSAFPST